MEHAIPIIAVCATIIITCWTVIRMLRGSARKGIDEQTLALIQNQASNAVQQSHQQSESLRKSMNDAMQSLKSDVSQALAGTNRIMGDRLDNTSKVIGDVKQQLGKLDESSRHMLEIGKDIASLQDILRPPKLRGSLGELFLEDLLAQILPANHYELQHHFKGGEAVDAVVKLRSGMVPVDAKFPLENLKRLIGAADKDEEKTARKSFVNDVKKHIDDIEAKYIRTDEGTFDFALMYIPAENVYYETIVKENELGNELALFNYAMKKRVIPVSPNNFYIYLQTILLGLKGMKVEERTQEIVAKITRLNKEFGALAEDMRLVGQHLDNSRKKYGDAEKRLGRIETRMEGMLTEPGDEPVKALAEDSAG